MNFSKPSYLLLTLVLLLVLLPLLSLMDNNSNTALGFRPSKMYYFIAINPGASDKSSQSPYNSSKITVPVGSNVTWISNDQTTTIYPFVAHTITSGDPIKGPSNVFYSGDIQLGQKFSFIFDKTGSYPYYDRAYPHMKGQVIVLAANDTTTSTQ